MTDTSLVLLVALGIIIGLFGTMIGAGGGFILTPILLLVYPEESPDTITSISLFVTFANALSGSVAYAQMRRINYKYGIIFTLASIPGAIAGAYLTHLIPRRTFDLIFSLILITASVFIFIKTPEDIHSLSGSYLELSRKKTITGIIISFFVGVISTFLGIGGGIIHVPVLSSILDFPIHIATATSHFILSIVTFFGVLVHVYTGAFMHGMQRALALAAGVLAGAQIGARLSSRISGKLIIRYLAVALFFVGIRLLALVLYKI